MALEISYCTEISTRNGWWPLEMAKFSEGLYDAPQGPVIGGPEKENDFRNGLRQFLMSKDTITSTTCNCNFFSIF